MKRYNHYQIIIKLDTLENDDILFSSEIPYKGSTSCKDEIKILKNIITINAKRSNGIKLDEVFYNHSSSIYNQIMKTLVYYYALDFSCPKISEISITHTIQAKTLNRIELKGTEVMA